MDICNEVHCKIDTLFEWIYKGSLGNKKFKELASTYWEENLFIIDDANSELRKKESIMAVRDTYTKKVRYDFDFWKKCGLINKKHIELEVEDVKGILEKSDYNL